MANARDFGAAGDGKTDDTDALEHAIADGDAGLILPEGRYRITRPLRIHLGKVSRFSIAGTGGAASIVMAGAGPALEIVGTHAKTADPADFEERVWIGERYPTVLDLEIQGEHPEADGIVTRGTMQCTLRGVVLRKLRHAFVATKRCRNLLIADCHIYDNRGHGVYFDGVNLHQAIIVGSHISYCRRGGIQIERSEIRNLQITGNDIEYNFDPDTHGVADVLIDCTAEGATVREGTISGNTIQAKHSPGGANVRFLGKSAEANHQAGMFTISGNLIGSQEVNVDLQFARGVVVEGNVIYSGHHKNLRVHGSRNIVLGNNSFDHNPDYEPLELCTGIRIEQSQHVTLTGSVIQDCQAGRHSVNTPVDARKEALVEVIQCLGVSIVGCQILDGVPAGLLIHDGSQIIVASTRIVDTREKKSSHFAVRCTGTGTSNALIGCTLSRGTKGVLDLEDAAGLVQNNTLVVQDH